MATITELYIGLETKDQNLEIHPSEVIDRIKDMVDAGTFKEAKGVWKGESEDSIIFECVDIDDHLVDHDSVEALARELEDVFGQESIMVKRYDAEVSF